MCRTLGRLAGTRLAGNVQAASALFEEAVDWLREHYGQFEFWVERRANLRSLSVTNVALGSHELECPRLVAADPFCGFLDGLDVFHAE